MISEDDIRQLQEVPSGTDSLVLSLYVDIDQSNAANLNRGFETAVEDQLRQIAEQESRARDGRASRFEQERGRVLGFLKSYTPRGKGVVIFSDSARGFWWQRDLQVELPTRARWSPQPWVRPLLELLEENEPLGVVLIDKHRARILTLDAGGLKQQADMLSDVPNRHHTTGTDHIWSQGQMERDHLKHIKWHAKRAADELMTLVERLKFNRLVIGGAVEAASIFEVCLPKRLQQMILNRIAVPVDISSDRLAAELRSIQGRAEHADEIKAVESLITSARKGDRAVLGISETLAAIHEGRVYRLVVDRRFRAEGKQCASCKVLLADGLESCSFCGGKLESAPDLVNRASHKVLERSGKVQVVSGAAAERLSSVGGIGAILRF